MQSIAAVATADEDHGGYEAELIDAAKRDRARFGALYQCHVDRVYAYIRSRAQNDDDAADLTQQVFLQAMAALPQYQPRDIPFRAWLLRIARNLAINHHRKHRGTIGLDLLPPALQPVCDDDTAGQLERSETISWLFVRLDAQSRELLILRFGAELSVREIAPVIGISEAATRMRLIRILRALKEQLHDDLR